MFPSVEVIRAQSNQEPRIIVQEREDTPVFAMTVQEAHRFLESEGGQACRQAVRTVSVVSETGTCTVTHRDPSACLWCMVNEALEGIRQVPPVRRKTVTRRKTATEVGLTLGFRSGLEDALAAQLKSAGVSVEYESVTLEYIPDKPKKYTPDFVLPNGIIIESKGRFVTADRTKHRLVKKQHPDLDIRFVFSNSRSRISKQSATTYADWCRLQGFQFADRCVPNEWLQEPPNRKSLAALQQLKERKKK